ncbi:hypothetical protein [Pontibacter harenae]|uniref:hypothetical protein n=1 Tax=Pontibacter harenae TaxID=2894083 RepID=UPI001E5D545A|nr:hypothetical protein [Pontibacter harenae]MCC9166107.1 hypothetical protein [Pontibacter harenae]
MQNRRNYRIVVTIVCLVLAGVNAYKVYQGGDYRWVDIFLVVVFLTFGIVYLIALRKEDNS